MISSAVVAREGRIFNWSNIIHNKLEILKLNAVNYIQVAIKLEKWEGSVIKGTTTLSLEELTQYIKTFYNYGVNPSESDNYYNPAPEVEALFIRDDFKVFSKGWSFSFGSVIKNNPAVLDGYNLYLTSMVKIEALNELVPVLTKYSYGQQIIKTMYSNGILVDTSEIDFATLTQELKLYYDIGAMNSYPLI